MGAKRRRIAAGKTSPGGKADERRPLAEGDVLLQISTADNDYFRSISLADLRRVARSKELTPRRNASVWELSRPHAVESTGVIDYVLVLDGDEDDASWAELAEGLE